MLILNLMVIRLQNRIGRVQNDKDAGAIDSSPILLESQFSEIALLGNPYLHGPLDLCWSGGHYANMMLKEYIRDLSDLKPMSRVSNLMSQNNQIYLAIQPDSGFDKLGKFNTNVLYSIAERKFEEDEFSLRLSEVNGTSKDRVMSAIQNCLDMMKKPNYWCNFPEYVFFL